MNACPTCGKQHEPTIHFCPDDGTPLSETAVFGGPHTPTCQQEIIKLGLDLPVVVGERYKLTEIRGGGGMAKVYRAVDQTLERDVAVKLINAELRADPEFDARFQREARIASQLADPHIVVVHDFGIDSAYGPFLVMEYLQGSTLRERLHNQGSLPVSAATQLWEQLLLALIHAHGKGIVHRDIKPDNLFLLSQGSVRMQLRVLDFGIARMLKRGEPGDSQTLTSPGAVLGTPRYMSPEQLAGQTVDARSDLYSSALVVHEALTGDLPYVTSRKLSETCAQAPLPLQQLVEHCLKPTPDERPTSAEEVYQRLQKVTQENIGSQVIQESTPRHPQTVLSSQSTITFLGPQGQNRARRKLKIALFAVLIILVLFGVLGTFKDRLKGDKSGITNQESLLGVQIGFDRDRLIAAVKKAPDKDQPHGNPWKGDHKEALGHVLKPEDVQDESRNLDDLDTLLWSDSEMCVLMRGGSVLAMVVRGQPEAASARGVKMGTSLKEVEKHYPLDSNPHEMSSFHIGQKDRTGLWPLPFSGIFALDGNAKSPKKPTEGHAYRFNELGIGFEIVKDKVSSITLYPRNSPSESIP